MITLERFTENDFDRFIGWIENEEQLIQFAGPLFKFPLTEIQLQSYLEQNKKVPYRIRLNETKEIIGHCELNYENAIPRLSRILIGDKNLRNKGIGKLIVKAMVDLVFQNPNCCAVDLSVFDWNASAIACYNQMGFVVRPDLITSMLVSGKTWNAYNMLLDKVNYLK